MNIVLETIKKRRSIRAYQEKQIKQEELDLIIEAGIYAPTGHNDQPWHFTVIQNKEKIQYISDISKELMTQSDIPWVNKMGSNPKLHLAYNAPTMIIVSGRKDAVAPQADCNAAIQNMLIAAQSLKVASVWLGLVAFFFSLEDEVKSLGIPEGYEPYYGVALGYSALEKEPTAPKRNLDVVNYIR